MSILVLTGWAAITVIAFMTLVWVASLFRKNASIVDVYWGIGFIVVAFVSYILRPGVLGRAVTILVMVSLWGGRLAWHLAVRNWGKGEDWRYRAWRAEAPERFWWTSYFRVFLLQGVLLVIVSAPLILVVSSPEPSRIGALGIAGIGVWGMGLFFEALGDAQLGRFKRDPANKGKVLDRGLWRFTRHPNYFGESLIWWGFFLVALEVPGGGWSVVSPVLMTFLLLRVSGVRMLEGGLKERKPEYADYIRRTSPFIPWPPKRG